MDNLCYGVLILVMRGEDVDGIRAGTKNLGEPFFIRRSF